MKPAFNPFTGKIQPRYIAPFSKRTAVFADDTAFGFGNTFSAPRVKSAWDTQDPNAKMYKTNLPTQDAENVPVHLYGVGIIGNDLGFLNGQSEPFVGVVNNNKTVYGGFGIYDANDQYVLIRSNQRIRIETGHEQFFITGIAGSAINSRMIGRCTKPNGQSSFEFGEAGASTGYIRVDGGFDQMGLIVSSFTGRQVVLLDANQRDRDQDIAIQNHPVLVIKENTNPNDNNGRHVAYSPFGMRGGRLDAADFYSSSFDMETDEEPSKIINGAASAFQNAANITNKDGADWESLGGNANLLDTVGGNGGDVIERPGQGNSLGRSGRYVLARRGLTKLDGQFNYQNEIATTDATVTTIETIATADDTIIHVYASVSTIQDDGSNAASYLRVGTFKNDGGVLGQVGATTNVHTAEDVAGWDCTLDTNGTNIRVRVTGAAATNLQWSSNVRVEVTNV